MRGEDGDQEAMYHTMDTIEGICILTEPDHLQEDEIDSTGTKFDSNNLTTDLYYKSGLYQVLSMFPYGNFQFKQLNFLFISHVTHGEIPAELTGSEGKTTNCDNAVADRATPLSLTLGTTAGKELKVVGTAFEIPQSDRIENASGGISKQLSQNSAIFNLHCPTVPLSHFTTVLLSYFTTWTESDCSMYGYTNSNKAVGNLQVAFTQSEKTCYDEIDNTISPSYNNLMSNTGEDLHPGRPMMTWDTSYYATCSVYYDRPVVNYDNSTNMDQFRGLGFRKEPGELGSAFTFLKPDCNHAVVNLVTNPSLGLTANKKLVVVVGLVGKEEPSLAASGLQNTRTAKASYAITKQGNIHLKYGKINKGLLLLEKLLSSIPPFLLPSSEAEKPTLVSKLAPLVKVMVYQDVSEPRKLGFACYSEFVNMFTLGQRIIYFVSCIFITIAMMTSSLNFTTVIILPVFTYIGRYHIMILVILFAAFLGLGTLISLTLAFFGMNPATITTDRVVPRLETKNLLTNFLRFSQVGSGQWASLLYAATCVAPGFSMVHGELHTSFHLKSKLVITNPSPGVTAIKKPKMLEVARKEEKSGLTTSCLQTTRPMDSIIFTKAESTPNTTTMTFSLPPKPTVSTTPPYLGQNMCTSSDNEKMLTEKVDQGKVQHSSLLSHPRADNLTRKHPGHAHPHLCDCCVRPQPSHNVIHIG